MSTAKKTVYAGVFVALAMIFSYIEFLFPLNFGIPGIKLGLANIVVVIMMYIVNAPFALVVNLTRILLSSLLFGNTLSLLYSLAGGLLSFTVMVLLKKTEKFSIVGVSVSGGVMHNVGQLLVATLFLENTGIITYLPVLMISGALTGALLGIIAVPVTEKLKGKVSVDRIGNER